MSCAKAIPVQAAAGSFSAYAYEALPIMHTLMGQSQLEERQFRADSHAFFSGYRGHINAAMRQFTANVGDGLQGPEAAVDTDAAHALIKVRVKPEPLGCHRRAHAQIMCAALILIPVCAGAPAGCALRRP